MKLDKSGKLIWEKTYGGTDDEQLIQMKMLQDSSLVLIGGTSSNDGDVKGNHGGTQDIWVVRLAKDDSTILWEKCLGGSDYDVGSDIITLNTGFLLTGATSSNDGNMTYNHLDSHKSATEDMWLANIDDTGAVLWQKSYGGTGSDYGNSIILSFDKGYLIGGSSSSQDGDVHNYYGGIGNWVVKLSSQFQIIILQNSGCLPHSIKLTTDKAISPNDSIYLQWNFGDGKGFVSGGDTVSSPSFNKVGNYVVKLGVINNLYSYTGLVLSTDSVTLTIKGAPSTPNTILKGKDTLMASYIGDSCEWYLNDTLVSKGKCEYIPKRSGTYKVVVDSGGCPSQMSAAYNFTYTGIEVQDDESALALYPNPTNSKINIQFTDGSISNSNKLKVINYAILTNLNGRELLSQSFMTQTIFDISMLPPGLYLLKCQNNESVWTRKVVKY